MITKNLIEHHRSAKSISYTCPFCKQWHISDTAMINGGLVAKKKLADKCKCGAILVFELEVALRK